MNVLSNVSMEKPEFLAWVQGREGRYELAERRVVMMTGGSRGHAIVLRRLASAVEKRLEGDRWGVLTSEEPQVWAWVHGTAGFPCGPQVIAGHGARIRSRRSASSCRLRRSTPALRNGKSLLWPALSHVTTVTTRARGRRSREPRIWCAPGAAVASGDPEALQAFLLERHGTARRQDAAGPALTNVACRHYINLKKSLHREDRLMWLHLQTWIPLLTIGLAAAICLGVASFVMSHQAPHP